MIDSIKELDWSIARPNDTVIFYGYLTEAEVAFLNPQFELLSQTKGINFIVVPPELQFQSFSEEQMNALGWHRKLQ